MTRIGRGQQRASLDSMARDQRWRAEGTCAARTPTRISRGGGYWSRRTLCVLPAPRTLCECRTFGAHQRLPSSPAQSACTSQGRERPLLVVHPCLSLRENIQWRGSCGPCQAGCIMTLPHPSSKAHPAASSTACAPPWRCPQACHASVGERGKRVAHPSGARSNAAGRRGVSCAPPTDWAPEHRRWCGRGTSKCAVSCRGCRLKHRPGTEGPGDLMVGGPAARSWRRGRSAGASGST